MTAGAYTGELAALGTACCWTVSSLAFTAAARRFGSLTLNVIRMVLACLLFVGAGWATRGLPLPTDATAHAWFWLTLSGLVGFTLGDLCLFRAFVLMGPRVSLLVLTLWPMLAALISWVALAEGLSVRAIVGMVLTMAGVAWVILERRPAAAPPGAHATPAGVLLALGSVLCQASGVVMTKYGMADYDALAATEIRALAGLAGFLVIFTAVGAWPRAIEAARNAAGMGYTALGAVFGPFLGVWLLLVGIQRAEVGVVSTLSALTPLLIIPPSIFLFRERVSVRAVFGAVVAVAGVALLLL